MKNRVVTKRPVLPKNQYITVMYPDCPDRQKAKRAGVLFREELSRAEESWGHEGFKCDRCDYRVKWIPPEPL